MTRNAFGGTGEIPFIPAARALPDLPGLDRLDTKGETMIETFGTIPTDYVPQRTYIPIANPIARNITGETFGKLTAIAPLGRDAAHEGDGAIFWLYRCSCGQFHEARWVNIARRAARGGTPRCTRCWRMSTHAERTLDDDSEQAARVFGEVPEGYELQNEYRPIRHFNRLRNLYGMRFGELTAIAPLGKRLDRGGKDNNVWWLFLCDCGALTEKRGPSVTSGAVVTCGSATHNE
jgi:hypothetical protein